MHKKLFIIRHGKSSWESEVGDIDRPLTERGVRNSYEMATRLADAGMVPEKIYSSTGMRALHTAVIMARVWELPDEALSQRDSLYMSGKSEIDTVLAETPEDVHAVAIFGHNPTFTGYANLFVNQAIDNIPTAGVVVLTFDTDNWNEISRSNLVEEVFDYPKKQKTKL